MKKNTLLFYCFICLTTMGPVFSQNTRNESILCRYDIPGNLKEFFNLTFNTANNKAVKLSRASQLQVDYFDVLYDMDGKPVKCVFEYLYTKESEPHCLTLGISLDSGKLALKDYYFGTSLEKKWRETLHAEKDQKIVVCKLGTFIIRQLNEYLKYPDNKPFSRDSILKNLKNTSKSKRAPDLKEKRNFTSSEVIIPGVPNYSWYMNCALTSWTMIIGYWNDKGYNTFIPGGNSIDGHYWAVTEELCYLNESGDFGLDQVKYYFQAREYGNNSSFDAKISGRSHYDKEEFWNIFKKMIDSIQVPIVVTWEGPPYGAHSTVGIGYKTEEDQRFLILYDTFRDVPYFVNYDEYFESLTEFTCYFPAGKKSTYAITNNKEIKRSVAPVTLESLTLNIEPPLDPAVNAYHSFELADLNGDSLQDLIVCNFRDAFELYPLKVYYNNGTAYVEDSAFRPAMQWYECMGISKTFDYDNDGDLDIAVTGYWSYVYVFINDGDHINSVPINVDTNGRGFIGLECGDYNNDGYADLISTSVNGQIRLYKNENGNFVSDEIIDLGTQSYKVKLIDVNNDHFPDLVASRRNGTVVLFYNDNGRFNTTPDFSPQGHGGLGFDIADMNNDGWPDIVGSNDGKLIIYRNKSGVFTDNPQHINNYLDCYPKDITIADLNKDNFPELLIANYNHRNFILANNNGYIDPEPVWQACKIDPTINIRVFDNEKGERQLLLGKSRGGSLEFYKVDYSYCVQGDTVIEVKSICEGENYQGWTQSGDYSRKLRSVTGCDSMVITNLIVNIKPLTPSITQSGDTLKSNEMTGNQWYFNNIELANAPGRELVMDEYGDYYVIVVGNNGCISEKSNTITRIPTSVKFQGSGNIRIYPNPAGEILTVEGLPDYAILIAVTDMSGNLVRVLNSTPKVTQIDISGLSKGMYFIHLNNQNGQAIAFVKQ